MFVAPSIADEKLKELKKHGCNLYISHQSLRQANLLNARLGIPNLRSSVDDTSIEGYKSLAAELLEQLPECDAVFSYATSGSSLIGMTRFFLENKGRVPEMHAVQSGTVCEIAEGFGKTKIDDTQVAGVGGIRNTRRKNEVIECIKSTGGSGWVASNDEIRNMKKILAASGIFAAPEACASVAAGVKGSHLYKWKKVVIIISGKDWSHV